MKWKFVLAGMGIAVAAIATSIPFIKEAQANRAASDILEDYKICRQGYSLLGAYEKNVKLLGTKDEFRGLQEHLKTLKAVEDSCKSYYGYFQRWGSTKIEPPDELFFALVSRYEPEKLKQK